LATYRAVAHIGGLVVHINQIDPGDRGHFLIEGERKEGEREKRKKKRKGKRQERGLFPV
jgi:hypothetical protein